MQAQKVKFCYLYRDAGNNKNYGTVIFANDTEHTLPEIETLIKSRLTDGQWFVAEDWHLPDLHFKDHLWDETLDHDLHEYEGVEEMEGDGGDITSLKDFLFRL